MSPVAFLLTLSLVACLSLACGPKAKSAGEVPSGDPNRVVGHVKWSITGRGSSNPIDAGERDVKLGELRIDRIDDSSTGKLTKVEIPLAASFTMALAQGEDATQGFGLLGQKSGEPTFGWDWFTISGNRATKLQETGEIELEWEGKRIRRTVFLSDVSLRVSVMREGVDPLDPEWRVLISKGSHIEWPN